MLVTGSLTTILLVLFGLFYFRKELKAVLTRSSRILDIATETTERNVATLASENFIELIDRQDAIAAKLGITSRDTNGKPVDPYVFYKNLTR